MLGLKKKEEESYHFGPVMVSELMRLLPSLV